MIQAFILIIIVGVGKYKALATLFVKGDVHATIFPFPFLYFNFILYVKNF
jgi:hypothetical protein